MHQIKSKLFVFICTIFFSSILFVSPVFASANTNNSTLSVSSSSIPADGSTTTAISVTVKDDSNNPISGDTVTLTSTGDTGLVINGGNVGADNATATTDSNGNVTFTVSSNNPNPGTDTFTAADTSDNPSVPLGSNSNVTITFKTPGSCTDGAPGSTPQLTSAVANGTNQITLTWTDANSPVSYYLLAYGITSGQYIYGNPNVGGQGTTSYTVGNLAKGTTYYFAVKAVNGCNPGSFSNEISGTTAGGVVVAPATSTDTSSNNQNEITPTDTPVPPSPTPQATATPTPIQTSTAGISKTRMLIYILIFIVVVGGAGNFIYWRYKRGMKKSVEIFGKDQLGKDLNQKEQGQKNT
jgi:adhesin/invasin